MTKANDSVDIKNLDSVMKIFIAELEDVLGYELIITSGYRGPAHPIEAKKKKPGEHSTGLAIDVVGGTPAQFLEIVGEAYKLGCKRIGVSRVRGFIHLGLDSTRVTSIWTY